MSAAACRSCSRAPGHYPGGLEGRVANPCAPSGVSLRWVWGFCAPLGLFSGLPGHSVVELLHAGVNHLLSQRFSAAIPFLSSCFCSAMLVSGVSPWCSLPESQGEQRLGSALTFGAFDWDVCSVPYEGESGVAFLPLGVAFLPLEQPGRLCSGGHRSGLGWSKSGPPSLVQGPSLG